MRASRSKWLALLGVFAVLFQAILFGWHHHDLALPSRGTQPVAFANSAVPLSPAAPEDDCDICRALHHLTGAPGEFVALAAPPGSASALPLPDLILAERRSEHAFEARAPPRA